MTPKDYQQFGLYAKDKGISSLGLHYHTQKIEDSLTPYILEESQLNMTIMDVFSRFMMERTLWIAGPVDDNMATIVQAQLLYLTREAAQDSKGLITIHIDTPGGSVKAGLSMVNVMEIIDCEIRTICTGMAASMGSVLLGAGTKGQRCSLEDSEIMLHQSSGGAMGNIQDAEISMKWWKRKNDRLFELLGKYCGKTTEQVKSDTQRDFWLTAQEAVEYGLIDEIVKKKKK